MNENGNKIFKWSCFLINFQIYNQQQRKKPTAHFEQQKTPQTIITNIWLPIKQLLRSGLHSEPSTHFPPKYLAHFFCTVCTFAALWANSMLIFFSVLALIYGRAVFGSGSLLGMFSPQRPGLVLALSNLPGFPGPCVNQDPNWNKSTYENNKNGRETCCPVI